MDDLYSALLVWALGGPLIAAALARRRGRVAGWVWATAAGALVGAACGHAIFGHGSGSAEPMAAPAFLRHHPAVAVAAVLLAAVALRLRRAV